MIINIIVDIFYTYYGNFNRLPRWFPDFNDFLEGIVIEDVYSKSQFIARSIPLGALNDT